MQWCTSLLGIPHGASGKEPDNAGDLRDMGSVPFGKIPWRRTWQFTPLFLPGETPGQRSLEGYSP